jgi:hypothetical protein
MTLTLQSQVLSAKLPSQQLVAGTLFVHQRQTILVVRNIQVEISRIVLPDKIHGLNKLGDR